ncbi:MAG: sulfite exporter TauE/SafE family protein [Planctomycetota bacterium]
MLFPTAGIEIPIWLPPLVAFVISSFTSMGGVSGAFLLLPFQMSVLGYVNPSVSATNHLFNVVAIPGGVYRYYREGRLVWPLTAAVIAGTLPGVFLGALVRVAWLPDPARFKLFAAGVLLYIGQRMVRDLVRSARGPAAPSSGEQRFRELMRQQRDPVRQSPSGSEGPGAAALPPAVRVVHCGPRRLEYTFCGEVFVVRTWGILALSFIVGVVGGIYGIGGGAIIAPFLVSFFGLPVYTVAGAALLGTFVTSAAAVGFYQAMAPLFPNAGVAPDWLLGALFGLGGMAGMYLGARCQKLVPARAIKWLLAGIMVFTALRYVAAFAWAHWHS